MWKVEEIEEQKYFGVLCRSGEVKEQERRSRWRENEGKQDADCYCQSVEAH